MGVGEHAQNDVHIAQDENSIRITTDSGALDATLIDVTGRVVRDFGTVAAGTRTIDVSGLANGMYTLVLLCQEVLLV